MENESIIKWETNKGVIFLKEIGVKEGMEILDFGARSGNYSIPAAIAVGKKGSIYALDKELESLQKIETKKTNLRLDNITTVQTEGSLKLEFPHQTFNMVLAYDVLHYLKEIERNYLFTEFHRILKSHSILSIYPKHVEDDWPMDGFKEMTIDDVINEIENVGFKFQGKYCGKLSHDSIMTRGCVYNFKKIH